MNHFNEINHFECLVLNSGDYVQMMIVIALKYSVSNVVR